MSTSRSGWACPAYRAEDPMIVTAVGAGRALDDLAFLRRTMIGI